ncbi:Arp2/3 complex, 34 kd subunit p34-Arc-domain-containing protein [Lipomyces tetrasporus]|uniref:Arp2/3 complex 34 kDa subunit n=1 Tax=Lipomyces tetrasporus TaxID=54092 RepID=A0AAD7QT85_9ASCO|nr:Arp2/3 complex, 34 kd subunit p34-Arc-domain-containing protein [Lipomyces tetrasporus]KAJ8101074.1 Arp2/3 complex, 34 kd subunit p34-Arc-domain-containing protein [Lipomyces tetrasporus]
MLLLQYHNLLIQSILTERFSPDNQPVSIDQVISDFDNVTYHISTPESKTKILISLSIKCFNDLQKYGVEELLRQEYGPYIVSPPETGYDFSMVIDLDQLPPEIDAKEALIEKIALLKRNALAAPFEKAFAQFDELSAEAAKNSLDLSVPEDSGADVMAIHYRDEESIFIKASHDRVTVIFSTVFREETDRVFGKVFLQEFVDARRRAIQNAPQVLYSHKEPPLEIRSVPGLNASDDIGFVTFVLFPRHITRDRRDNCISHIQIFRDYFHYHIKCSKAYMHSRMRFRVADFLKVLNRAKPEVAEKERKTASGRRFGTR